MTDCANVEMREKLPELAHEALGAAESAAVMSHVAQCPECAAELDLIRAVIASASPVPAMDVAAIAAALPQPPAQADSVARPTLIRDGRVLRFGIRQLPLAAALALAASVTFVVVRGENTPTEIRTIATKEAPVITPMPSTPPPLAAPPTKSAARATHVAAAPTLTLGGSTEDLSDESLAMLVDEVERMDGVPGAEPESLEPSLGEEEGGR
jgi:anti-sigma factor RsiW